jgi:hypothetical protein
MYQEWMAEVVVLEREGGTVFGRLQFVLSMVVSPPLADENGAPRGWREGVPGLGPALPAVATLMLAAALLVPDQHRRVRSDSYCGRRTRAGRRRHTHRSS